MFVSGIDAEGLERAMTIIDTIVNDPEPGAIYNGKVTRLMDFGAFVEIAPGKEGLVHISRLDVKRTEKVTDVVNVGDEIMVKVLEIDDKGRLNLSRRDALIEVEGLVPENDISEERRPPRRPATAAVGMASAAPATTGTEIFVSAFEISIDVDRYAC